MPTRNVVLTDHQSELLDRLVASGRYQNASEAIRAGLRRLEDFEAAQDRLKAYLDDIEANSNIVDAEGLDVVREAFARARAKHATKAAE
ncbi:MAG: type II toxin-antitoxin system ParD family antitoxin [Pseudomonadota bacterium]